MLDFQSEKHIEDQPTRVLSLYQISLEKTIVRSIPEIDYIKQEFYFGVKNHLQFYSYK